MSSRAIIEKFRQHKDIPRHREFVVSRLALHEIVMVLEYNLKKKHCKSYRGKYRSL